MSASRRRSPRSSGSTAARQPARAQPDRDRGYPHADAELSLFFADDRALTCHLLDTACDFAASVPAFRLAFAPDARVWNTIT